MKNKKLHKRRDPHMVALIQKSSGAHIKTYKAQRNKDKAAIKQLAKNGKD